MSDSGNAPEQSVEPPEGLVPLDYVMDPKTEDLVYGDELRDGDVVLIETGLVRFSIPKNWAEVREYERVKILENSRWCVITKLRRTPGYGDHNSILNFIGVYEDGTKMSRSFSESYAWFRKLVPSDSNAEFESTALSVVNFYRSEIADGLEQAILNVCRSKEE